ncbi:MAG: hypothetical protein LBR49_08760, partial [Tannerella sp.]|nr:hypothetical protein [Tannerella sp.]
MEIRKLFDDRDVLNRFPMYLGAKTCANVLQIMKTRGIMFLSLLILSAAAVAAEPTAATCADEIAILESNYSSITDWKGVTKPETELKALTDAVAAYSEKAAAVSVAQGEYDAANTPLTTALNVANTVFTALGISSAPASTAEALVA